MKTIPSMIIFLNEISSKELAETLDKLPDCANVINENNTLLIYF